MLTVDELEHQKRLSVRGRAGIDEACNIRMDEARQEASLALESFEGLRAERVDAQQLDGKFALEMSVAAMREPDLTHAAIGQQRVDRVCADLLTDAGMPIGWDPGRMREELIVFKKCALRQYLAQRDAHLRLLSHDSVEPLLQLRGRHVLGFVQPGINAGPGFFVQLHEACATILKSLGALPEARENSDRVSQIPELSVATSSMAMRQTPATRSRPAAGCRQTNR